MPDFLLTESNSFFLQESGAKIILEQQTSGNYFFDDFNRFDSTNLGSNWIENLGNWEIRSNQLDNITNSPGFECIATYSGTIPSPDYMVTANLIPGAGIIARYTDINNFYYLRVNGGNGNLEFYSKVNGVFILLNSVPCGITPGISYLVRLVMLGSNLVAELNGIKKINITDTVHTQTGTAGVRIFANLGADGFIDNFSIDQPDLSSPSPSASPSASPSLSPSASISSSPSPSQQIGSNMFSRGSSLILPNNKNNLTIIYKQDDEEDITYNDGVFINITDTYPNYLIHQFRLLNLNNRDNIDIKIRVKSTLAPTISPVYLQIWHAARSQWRTLTFDNTAKEDEEFSLVFFLDEAQVKYYDSINEAAVRVYQQLTP